MISLLFFLFFFFGGGRVSAALIWTTIEFCSYMRSWRWHSLHSGTETIPIQRNLARNVARPMVQSATAPGYFGMSAAKHLWHSIHHTSFSPYLQYTKPHFISSAFYATVHPRGCMTPGPAASTTWPIFSSTGQAGRLTSHRMIASLCCCTPSWTPSCWAGTNRLRPLTRLWSVPFSEMGGKNNRFSIIQCTLRRMLLSDITGNLIWSLTGLLTPSRLSLYQKILDAPMRCSGQVSKSSN